MDDGKNGGQRYIIIKGMKTDLLPSKASVHFTLMGLNTGTDEPVLYLSILTAKVLTVADVKGFYYRASIPYESIITMEEKTGGVKALPGLPVCKFSRKLVPGLMSMSLKESISSKILTEAINNWIKSMSLNGSNMAQPPLGYCMDMEVDSSYCFWNISTPQHLMD